MKKMRNHIRMTTSLEEQLAELVRKYVQLADELEDSPEKRPIKQSSKNWCGYRGRQDQLA